jgi:hypothetical protein
MRRLWLLPVAAVGLSAGFMISVAQAQPSAAPMASFKPGASQGDLFTRIYDRDHRRCHRYRKCWHEDGHRHCEWRCRHHED